SIEKVTMVTRSATYVRDARELSRSATARGPGGPVRAVGRADLGASGLTARWSGDQRGRMRDGGGECGWARDGCPVPSAAVPVPVRLEELVDGRVVVGEQRGVADPGGEVGAGDGPPSGLPGVQPLPDLP